MNTPKFTPSAEPITTTDINQVTTEQVQDISRKEKINLPLESFERAMDQIRTHVEMIVPPAKTPAELIDDIRAALKESFPNFGFGEITPRRTPDEIKIQQIVETLGNRMPTKFDNIVYRLKEGGVSEAAAHAFAKKHAVRVNTVEKNNEGLREQNLAWAI